MDALSDVLSMLRVSSVLSSRFEGRGDWALRYPAYRHVKFGGVLEGRFYLWAEDDAQPLLLEEGDFYLLTSGQPFYSASDPQQQPEDGVAVARGKRGSDGIVRHEKPGESAAVSLASGRFTFESDAAELLLQHLPAVIHLPANQSGSFALSLMLELLRLETSGPLPGAEVARGSLAALVLVHVLRAHLAISPQPAGWLGALSDRRIGKSLSLMHAQPGERWTVESLAGAVNMSRTAFATRFRDLVGSAPLEYLNRWRMSLARSALLHSEEPLTHIAGRIGYLSDTAFNIAFKRWTGTSPGKYRALSRVILRKSLS